MEAHLMNQSTQFTLKDFILFALSVLTFGAGYLVDHRAAVIGFLAIGIIWLLTTLGKLFPGLAWVKGKQLLTALVCVAAFGLSLFMQPMTWPALPMWSGDAAAFAPLLAAFLAAFFANIQTAVLFALSVYPILLSQVTDKLSGMVTARIAPLLSK